MLKASIDGALNVRGGAIEIYDTYSQVQVDEGAVMFPPIDFDILQKR